MNFWLCLWTDKWPSLFPSSNESGVFRTLRKFILVLFDDILVYSPDLSSHVEHLTTALTLLRENTLFAKLCKRSFAQSQVEYLGHIIYVEGVFADLNKLVCMVNWPKPKSVKGLFGFLGLTGYYRRYIKNYGEIARPLTKLLQKDQFKWSFEATTTFTNLKKTMSSNTVLALPYFTRPFIIETEASSKGIGVVLIQSGRPLAFLSKAFAPKYLGLSVYEKELLAILQAVTKWRSYLIEAHFIIKIDHQSLKFFMKQRLSTFLQ